ncbi:MAG: hypothetical protein E4H27_00300 [Anaerolineales bacterium]|nr:MAG: hypothetical protein E4H27_00300 [Anaerolineales bacterium]
MCFKSDAPRILRNLEYNVDVSVFFRWSILLESKTKVHLSQAIIHTLTQAAFGSGSSILNITELTEGWYNTAYALTLSSGHKTVLKVGPPPDADILSYEHNIMWSEVEVMRMLEPDPAIPVPHMTMADFTGDLILNAYYFMDYVEGEVWNNISKQLTPAHNNRLSHQLGDITAHINRYTNDTFGYYAPSPRYSTWSDALHQMFGMIFTDADTYAISLPITLDEIFTRLEEQYPSFAEVTTPQLVHWDLWQGNVFVDTTQDAPDICAVIDFERVYWGDPLGEVFFRGSGNPSYIAGYGQPVLHTKAQRTRNLFYDLYLYVIMVVEDGPRQYSDKGAVKWARKKLDETLESIRQL